VPNSSLTYVTTRPTFSDPETWALSNVLRHWAQRRPSEICLDFPEEQIRYTYSEALTSAERVAGSLARAGATQGDRVVIMAQNSSQFVRTWLAAAVGGLVEVPINTNYSGAFLRHQLAIADARLAVIDDVHAARFVELAEEAGGIEKFWVVNANGEQAAAISLLADHGWTAHPWENLEAGEPVAASSPRAQDLGAIFFTSGTTGPSKGVAMSNSQLYFFGQEVVWLTKLTMDDTYLTVTPLFHGNAQFMAVLPALIVGGRAVIRSKFSASRWIDHVRESGATATNFVGVMMDFAWKQATRENDSDNSLRVLYAAPTASSIAEGFASRFGIEAIVDGFGLTETCAPILAPYGVPRPAGAVGKQASEWFDIRLVDPETDREVAVGEVGELVVRPVNPWTCSEGYYGMPEKTLEAWRNLWFHTGDALRKDADGWYYFVDRYKDALRRRGENISSYEIEQAVLGHPAVMECAVIGVPADVEAGEDEVLAVIVVNDHFSLDPAEVVEWCGGRIPSFAIPRYVRVIEQMPRTPSEKVQKAVLREMGTRGDVFDANVRR